MIQHVKTITFIVILTSIFFGGCAHIPLENIEKTSSLTISNPEKTALGELFAPAVERHTDKSGFVLLDKGEEALVWRGVLANTAERSIDAQYFIWEEDNTGTIAAEYLLRAAIRGVRIRVLIDDFPVNTKPRYLALLDAHPNIEIRIYNPAGRVSSSAVTKVFSAMYDLKRFNQRMHNKAYIVDGSITILGGRNIADEYYDLHKSYNFRDRDVLTMGPIVKSISRGFDTYWNSKWAIPVNALIKLDVTKQEMHAYHTALSSYAQDPRNHPERFHRSLEEGRNELTSLAAQMIWGKAVLINDIPGKNDDPVKLDAFGRSGEQLTKISLQAQQEILVQTPYLVMMPGTFSVVKKLVDRGVAIRIQTNSFASTDNLPAFAGYVRQREKILQHGVELYEQKPDPVSRQRLIERHELLDDKAIFALHAKTAVFDRKTVFIGSFNLDPRSTHLNTEMGLVIRSPELAEQVATLIERDMAPDNSWHLVLDEKQNLEWISTESGKEVRYSNDPRTGIWKGIKLFFYSLFPIEKLL
jgi:putative cardiolipin synthase